MKTIGKCGTSDNSTGRPIRSAINGPLRSTARLRLAVLPPVITKLLIFGAVLLTTAASQLSATELRAADSGTNLVLSWAQDSTNDFSLQVPTNLATPAGWRIAANPTPLVGNEYTTMAAVTEPQEFYRLKA